MSDSEEFGGLGTTTPYVPRTKPFVSEKVNSRAGTSAEAGPSNPTRAQLAAFGSRKTAQKRVHEIDDEDDEDDVQEVEARNVRQNGKRKETHVVEDEDDDDEIQEVDPPQKTKSRAGSRKPSSTVNGKPTNNGNTTTAAKGKAKAKPKIGLPRSMPKAARQSIDVDSNDVVEHEMDVDVNGVADIANAINAATENNAGRAPKIQLGPQNDDGTTARLEEQLRQAMSRIDNLTGRFNELCQIRNTEPELLLERMEAQYKMQLQAQKTLIANLNTQLARKDPVHRTNQEVFEILTREEANKEMHTLQAEVNEWRKRFQSTEKKLKEKEDEMSALQENQNHLRVELQAEIDRGKAMANRLQRQPPSTARPRTGGLSSTDDPKMGEIIKFYEDLTNLIVPSMKLQKGKYFDTDEWLLNCVYSYTDEVARPQPDSRTISFTLRLCKEPPTEFKETVESERQLVETVHYVPQNLDKESAEFRESLEFLNTTFTFERSQLALFIRTLHERMSGEGDSDENKSDNDVQIVDSLS